MEYDENTVIGILALAVPNDTPDHHLEYLVKKLIGQDSLKLDPNNAEIYQRIKSIKKTIEED